MESNIWKLDLNFWILLSGVCLVLGVAQSLDLFVQTVCDKDLTTVSLKWSFKHQAISYNCDVTYGEKGQMQQRVVNIVNNNVRVIRNLKNNTEYVMQVQCGNVSSPVHVVKTGVCLSQKKLTKSSQSPSDDPYVVVYKEKSVFTATSTDIVLGVVFGLVTICILVVTAYYMYQRYKRQRRLQQFLRTPHTDPLESLHSYMEEDS